MIRAKKNENNFSVESHAREMRVEPLPGLVALHLLVSSDVAQRRRTVFSRFHFGLLAAQIHLMGPVTELKIT